MKDYKLDNIKSSGFKMPEDYFKTFDDKILNSVKAEITLDQNIKSGFKEPEEYFETFDNKVLNTLVDKKNTKVISIFNRKNLIYISGIAAALIILLTLDTKENDSSFASLSQETIENYIIDESINSYEIASLLTDEQLDDNITIEYNFDDENIEAFLLENADIEYLMTE